MTTQQSPSRVFDTLGPASGRNFEHLGLNLYRRVALLQPERVCEPPSWLEHIPFAFWLMDAHRPDVFVELGTHSGNSYAAFAQAVRELNLPTSCFCLDTWEGDPHSGLYGEDVFEDWKRFHDARFASFSRLIRCTFAAGARYFSDGTVDLLHLDGYHTYESLAETFAHWRPKLSRRAVVLVHDISVHERGFGAWRLWSELKDIAPSFEFLHGYGLGVLGLGPELPERVRWLLESSQKPDDVNAIREFFYTLGRSVSAPFEAKRVLAQTTAQTDEAEGPAGQKTELGKANRDKHYLIEKLYEIRLERDALKQERDDLAAAHRRRVLLMRALDREMERPKLLRKIASTLEALGLPSRFSPKSIVQLLARPARLRLAHILANSGLFDESYYIASYPDVAVHRIAPLAHFILRGGIEDRNPHPLFDSAWYRQMNPDVAAARANPLVHYLLYGAREGRSPHPLFDVAYYTSQLNRELVEGNPLVDYVRLGVFEGRSPHPRFDPDYYLAIYPDVAGALVSPFAHFLLFGEREGESLSTHYVPAGLKAAGYVSRRYCQS